MDFLNKSYGQVVTLFTGMSPSMRIVTGLLTALIAVSAVFLFQYQGTTSDEFLYGGGVFTSEELGSMEEAFGAAGLNDSEIVGSRMRVPRGEKAAYMKALTTAGFQFDKFGGYMEQAVSGNNDMFVPRHQREVRSKFARQQDLATIVREMRDVQKAAVQLDEQKKHGFHGGIEKTALVAVQTIGGRRLDPMRVRAIRETVAGSIAGLSAESVTVTDMDTGVAYPGVSRDGSPLAPDNAYASHKSMYEEFWRDKILRRLSTIPGVNVEVNVQLNPELRNEEFKSTVDAKAVAIETSESTTESSTKSPKTGGRPGAVPNGVASNSSAQITESGGQESSNTESASTQRLLPSTGRVLRTTAPLVPKEVTASIGVPQSYYKKVWVRQNPVKEGEEAKEPDPLELKKIEESTRKSIEEAIVRLLPSVPAGVDPYPQVVITTYPDLAIAETPLPPFTDGVVEWLSSNWQTLGMGLLGLVGLVMLRSMVMSKATVESDAAPPLKLADVDDDETGDEAAAAIEKDNVLRKRFEPVADNLRSDLAELVGEDPDAAANVLSKWIGDQK